MPSPADAVLTALAAVAGGDVEGARAFVAGDFVWHVPGAGAIGGDVSGVDEWAAKLRRLIDAGLEPQLLSILEGGDQVAIVQRNSATSGERRLDVRVVNLFTVVDGKVARMETFFGDQAAVDRFWDGVLGTSA